MTASPSTPPRAGYHHGNLVEALLAAAIVLTFGVITGHVTRQSVLWQDEVTIYLIAGAIFLSAASVQAVRGHVGIDILDHWLPAAAGTRRLVVDALVLFFCVLFAWKSGSLLHEAWVDEQTSHSAWGPPLWIPYSLLTAGMVLLAAQVALQVAERSLPVCIIVLLAVVAFGLWSRPPLPLRRSRTTTNRTRFRRRRSRTTARRCRSTISRKTVATARTRSRGRARITIITTRTCRPFRRPPRPR